MIFLFTPALLALGAMAAALTKETLQGRKWLVIAILCFCLTASAETTTTTPVAAPVAVKTAAKHCHKKLWITLGTVAAIAAGSIAYEESQGHRHLFRLKPSFPRARRAGQ